LNTFQSASFIFLYFSLAGKEVYPLKSQIQMAKKKVQIQGAQILRNEA